MYQRSRLSQHRSASCRAMEDQVHLFFGCADGSAGFIGWPMDGNEAHTSRSAVGLGSIVGLALFADCSKVVALGCNALHVLQARTLLGVGFLGRLSTNCSRALVTHGSVRLGAGACGYAPVCTRSEHQ